MAENRYANAKCFVLAPDGYEEITYSELCRRRETDQSYEEKKFIPLHGMLMEVTPEQYREFYRNRRRQKYLDERSKDNGDISIDMLTTSEFNGADILISSEDVEGQVVQRMMVDKLCACLQTLSEEEQMLIHLVFYEGKTEAEASHSLGISQQAVSKRLRKILGRIKRLLES